MYNVCIMCIIMNTNPAPRHLTLVLLEAHGCLAKLLQVSMNMSQPNRNYQHGHSYQSFFVVVVFVFLCLSQIPGTGLNPDKTRIRAEELKIAWLKSTSHPEMWNFTIRQGSYTAKYSFYNQNFCSVKYLNSNIFYWPCCPVKYLFKIV